MEVRQRGFEPNPRNYSKNWQTFLKIGKVIGVNQARKTVDVSMMDGSGTYHEVVVLSPSASTASGLSYLPKMHLPGEDRDEPVAFERRDIYAVVGFINAVGTLPVVLGFKHPQISQLSFDNKEGFENQRLERHEGDRYHRIVGDTVAEFGGDDVLSEEEIRYPDNSYFRVYPEGDDRKLTNISRLNEDAEKQPFRVKKEEHKGFYFQHSSGTRILVDPDGQIKISHHTGSWLSISPNEDDIPVEPVSLETVDSKNNPQTLTDSSPVKIHLEHSSGTRLTIKQNGDIELFGVGRMDATTVRRDEETILLPHPNAGPQNRPELKRNANGSSYAEHGYIGRHLFLMLSCLPPWMGGSACWRVRQRKSKRPGGHAGAGGYRIFHLPPLPDLFFNHRAQARISSTAGAPIDWVTFM